MRYGFVMRWFGASVAISAGQSDDGLWPVICGWSSAAGHLRLALADRTRHFRSLSPSTALPDGLVLSSRSFEHTMRHIFRLSLLLSLAATPLLSQQAAGPVQQRAVLVTGASSGIGRKIAELLASQGHFVYAGARKPADIEELSKIRNMQGVKLDVTVASDIAAAVETVRKGGRGLHGIVNNAGIAILSPLVQTEEKEMASIFDVNVHGPYRITKAFAPLLVESKGRVVTVSSISGILSGGFFGPYSMTKHAVEAFGDALAVEMAPLGVRSSLIEPGNFRSEIGRTTKTQVEAAATRAAGSPFEAGMKRLVTVMDNYETYPEPDAVAEAASHALFSDMPKRRYMVVSNEREASVTINKAIEELVQLNQSHKFSYDREVLIRKLDSTLARIR
jgi:NAD(P)-dependent dehydrogenase (short-subunit alcohol dehydrogenase family)